MISALNVSSITGTNFKPSRKSIFVIHGFVTTGNTLWLVEMCQVSVAEGKRSWPPAFINWSFMISCVLQTLLEVSDVNCFCVDWSGGSFSLYTQASNNIRVVGAEIAYFLHFLQVCTMSASQTWAEAYCCTLPSPPPTALFFIYGKLGKWGGGEGIITTSEHGS